MLTRLANTGNEAADAQEELADASERQLGEDGGVGKRGEGGQGFSFADDASGLRQAVGGVASFGGGILSNAAGQFGQGVAAGDALESSALVAAKEYIQSNPEFSVGAFGFEAGGNIPGAQLLAASGVAQAFNNAEQAGTRVGNSLAGLAEQGVEIPQEVIDRQIEIETERVQRGNQVRARANAAAISVENIGSQVGGQLAEKVISLLERIANNADLTGGAQ